MDLEDHLMQRLNGCAWILSLEDQFVVIIVYLAFYVDKIMVIKWLERNLLLAICGNDTLCQEAFSEVNNYLWSSDLFDDGIYQWRVI